MTGWWEQHPDRWRRELDALAETGWSFEVVDDLTAEGIIGLQLRRAAHPPDDPGPDEHGPSELVLRVLFPPAYPFFPPVVHDEANALALGRHREPHSGRLCLVHDHDWDVTATLADLLTNQLPRLITAARTPDPDVAAALEVPTPEPTGAYVMTGTSARILVDSTWPIPLHATAGTLLVRFTTMSDGTLGPGLVTTVQLPGTVLETWPGDLLRQFRVAVAGRWTRRPVFDPTTDPGQLWQQVDAELPPLRHVEEGADQEVAVRQSVGVIGLLVPSEIRYRTGAEEWVFLVRSTPPDGEPQVEYRRAQPAGPDDYAARTPGTAGCGDRRVLLVGAGALGGTLALEFARAGIGRLDLVDGDVTDAATACRQLAPAAMAGLAKVDVLRVVLNELNPHTRVSGHVATLGSAQRSPAGAPDPHTAMAHLVGHADLVIDTAADPAVTRYLAALCVATGITLLHASATAGAWGGVVALFPATARACWWCLLHHRHDGSLPVPLAAPDPLGRVVPTGCQQPTFTGTGADLATIASHAARVTLQHLAPDDASDARSRPVARLYVAALRDPAGGLIPVRWTSRQIHVHRDCPVAIAHRRRAPRPATPRPAPRATEVAPSPEQETSHGHR